ncbi:transporter [Methylosinus sporium]|uniref:Transporter n=1 Tax=Methylosinus sporium TaxID=428 RepID=A0A549T6U7_METSR|nr:transporter [Methylosinus sporium]
MGKVYGPEVADAVEAAIKAGKDPRPVIERAEKARQEREERERLLVDPPPLHGSATWAKPEDLAKVLRGRDAFDSPSSILLGSYIDEESQGPQQFAHWDGDGHLLTVAPTRSGKAVTTIIPNLLRYRGSAVVLDPKGELYAATSKWRAENVGPVYRLAPFDDGTNPATANFPRHGFNPLTRVRSQADARSLAEQLFPRDPKSPEFFTDDAASFMTALIQFVLDEAPPHRRTLATVHQAAAQPLPEFKVLMQRLMRSRLPAVVAAADNILGKNGERGLPTFRDTLNSKLALWGDPAILASVAQHGFDFEALKEQPATVYIDVPFDLMKPYSPWLRVVLKSALDAMLRSPAKPEIPVLFVLDEFLALGPFAEFRDAIRTHAGAGVRLWFFLQDVGSLELEYPNNGWRPFFNCSVKQFFGIDDPFTGELIGKFLGNRTVAYRVTNDGGNISAQNGGWGQDSSTNVSMSSNESIQFTGRPLLTPDEVMELLSDWQDDGWRWGIIQMRGPRPFKVGLVSWNKSEVCRGRFGAFEI